MARPGPATARASRLGGAGPGGREPAPHNVPPVRAGQCWQFWPNGSFSITHSLALGKGSPGLAQRAGGLQGHPQPPAHTPGHWPEWLARCNWPGLGRLPATAPMCTLEGDHKGRHMKQNPKTPCREPPACPGPSSLHVQGLWAADRAEYLELASSARRPASRSGSDAGLRWRLLLSPRPGASCLHAAAREPLIKLNPGRSESQTPG